MTTRPVTGRGHVPHRFIDAPSQRCLGSSPAEDVLKRGTDDHPSGRYSTFAGLTRGS
jgi:hypothetical protein